MLDIDGRLTLAFVHDFVLVSEIMNGDAMSSRLEVRGVSKRYPGVRALDGFDLSLEPGEVRALLGKNGAGKSTLVRILSGAERPDEGAIHLNGEPAVITSPRRARELGIATVHQELSLVPELTVADNLLLGRWRAAGAVGPFISPSAIVAQACEHLAALDLAIDPRARIKSLSIAAQQSVEIARAVSLGSRVLILDEPTSSLPAAEVDVLIKLIRRLTDSGISVIYVSHRMDEIPLVADSVTVVRDGRLVETRPIDDAGTDDIVRMMTGGATHSPRTASGKLSNDVVLAVEGLCSGDRVNGVDFVLHRGEVLGIAGLLGSGRTEILRCLFGLDPTDAGRMVLEGRSYAPRSPKEAINTGIGFTPEDRKRDGVVLGMSVGANLVLAVLERLSRRGLLSRRAEKKLAVSSSARLAVKAPSLRSAVGTLSGGNQQKVILGKWLNAGVRLLLLDEPTRGIDIEAKEQIYQVIRELAADGVSTIVVSSETEELFHVCDRIVVLGAGRVVAERATDAATPSEVLALAMGGKQ
ncbi:sugar ABC transporter ATP-binding protein [Mycolicibacterium wolinskyi]|nr:MULTISPECIES: sugar ABC transporter ATP-binding protein [Mycolicibacterium]MCV7286300.1 sugar ABC transporter ATP-binding protein [Mycolicibacterium wolinskyi]MCV7293280.1 sugar ABC transporter ATP-binding protein [Mycolicibacterium goodii]